MISVKKAYALLKEKFPKRTVTEAAEYDNRFWVFVAVEDPNQMDFGNPFYLVDKRSGEIHNFSPVNDPNKFNDAFLNRGIELRALR